MKRKALFLLILFLLQTVAGIACTLHMKADLQDHKLSCHAKSMSKEKNAKTAKCCQDEVNATVKSISYAGNAELKAPVHDLLPAFFLPCLQVAETSSDVSGYPGPTKPPPSVDIRVAISSFLI